MDELEVRRFLMTDYPRIVGGLTLACGSRAAAEDAVQEALARAWERSERGLRIDSLTAWVTVVAANLARSGIRRRIAERRARARLVPASASASASPSGRRIGDTEDRIDVERALATLSRRQRQAVVLRYHLDMPVADVAEALGVSEGTAKTTLFRARAALARALGVPRDPERTARDVEEANHRGE